MVGYYMHKLIITINKNKMHMHAHTYVCTYCIYVQLKATVYAFHWCLHITFDANYSTTKMMLILKKKLKNAD